MEIGEMFGKVFGWAFNVFPYKSAKTWLAVYTNPHETMKKEMKNASLGEGAKNLLVVMIPYMFILGLVYFLMLGIVSQQWTSGILFLVGLTVFGPLLTLIITFIWNGLVWIVAKVLGGKGTYAAHFYINSLISAGIAVVGTLFLIPMFIPCIGYLFSVLIMVINIYALYLQAKSVRMVHDISRIRAVAAILIPAILFAVIIVVAYIAIVAAMFAAVAAIPLSGYATSTG